MTSNYTNALIEHYLKLAEAPLQGGSPAGVDARFSPEFEQLETELQKEGSLHDDNEVDWQRLRSGCEAFLGSQSKDLRVAVWLTWSLHQRESFPGLLAGFTLLHHLCKTYWPTLHPLKPRTRIAAFDWLVPRLDNVLSEHVAIAEQLPLFRQIAALLRDLEALLAQHLGAQAPMLLPLSRRLDDLVARADKGLPVQGAVGAVIAQVKQVASRVVFAEAGLAGLNVRESRRLYWGQRALYAGALACLALCGWLWANGFAQNHERFEQLRTLGQQFTQQKTSVSQQDDALVLLPGLDTSFSAVQVFPPKPTLALHERSGLYQGEPTTAVLRQRYQHELAQQLLPRIARQMEGQIQANLGNRDALLNDLRAYLMLGLPEQREANTLKDWMASHWEQRYATDPAAQARLNQHLSRLLEQPFRYPINEPLVAQARQALQKTPLASLVYRALGEQARSLAPYRLDEHLGPQGAVFTGSHAVIPGLYTKQGYQQFFLTRGVGLAHDLLRDNWIMGQSSNLDPIHVRNVMTEVEQLYFRDYADHWQQALAKIELQPLDSLAQGADHAGALVAVNSPLLQLLIQVRDNTRFPTLGESAAEMTEDVTPTVTRNAKAALAEKKSGDARSALQRRFEPLHRLLDEHNGASAELTPTLTALSDLHRQLLNLSQDSQPDQAAFEFAKARIQGKRSALDTLRNTASRLPSPVMGWLRVLSDDSWQWVLEDTYHYLNQRYQGELYSVYTAALHQRYPFHAHSSSEVALADFREFFKAQGTADSFFESYLKPFVSFDGAQYRLRTVEGRSLPMSRGVLQQMGNVQQIRRGFFAENAAEPLIKFSLEPYSLDSSLSRADFRLGDQHLEYRHGPIVATAFQWPAAADDGLSSLIVEELNGRRLALQKNTGQWSLFRLFDLMEKAPHRGRDVLMLKADMGGLRADYLLLSQRSPNPFDLTAVRNFRLPAAL